MQECDDGWQTPKPGLKEFQEPVGKIIGSWGGMSSSGPTNSSHHGGERRLDKFPVRFRGPWVRAGELPELFRSWDLAYRCKQAGWLKPILQGKRRTIYRLADVLECMRRIEAGELPSARGKSNIR